MLVWLGWKHVNDSLQLKRRTALKPSSSFQDRSGLAGRATVAGISRLKVIAEVEPPKPAKTAGLFADQNPLGEQQGRSHLECPLRSRERQRSVEPIGKNLHLYPASEGPRNRVDREGGLPVFPLNRLSLLYACLTA
jgi:hypothetical protein